MAPQAKLNPVVSRCRQIAALGLFLSAAHSTHALVVSGTGFNPYVAGYVVSTTTNVPLLKVGTSGTIPTSIPDPLFTVLDSGTTAHPQGHWQDGFLDVTKDPYDADPTSGTDSSVAIQEAIHDGYYYNFSVYFPSGTYLVSQPLSCVYPEPQKINPNLKFCNVLIGSSGTNRSVLKYVGTGTDNPFLDFQYLSGTGTAATLQPDVQYGSTLRSIDIDMEGNPGCDALSMEGSQNCDINDVTISGSFHFGVSGPPASGGSINNLRVIGGSVGIVAVQYRPNPVMAGITLTGQSLCGLRVAQTRGPVCLVGFNISNTDAPAGYVAISGTGVDTSGTDPRGDINLIDGSIAVAGSGSVAVKDFRLRINLAMRNVYIKAPVLIGNGGSPAYTITDTTGGFFNHFEKYVFSTGSNQNGTVYDQDETAALVQPAPPTPCVDYDPPVTEDPPADLVSRHLGAPFLDFSSTNTAAHNYYSAGTWPGVTPDDPTVDSSVGINNAINYAAAHGSNKGVVTLPRGHFFLMNPVLLKDGVSLIGGGKNSTILQIIAGSGWTGTTQTALLTTGSGTKGLAIQDFGLWGLVANNPSTAVAPNEMKYVSLLEVLNSNMTMHDVVTTKYIPDGSGTTTEGAAPVVDMGSSAGGRFYDMCLYRFEANTTSTSSYHLLHIQDSVNPIYIYAPSIEHQDQGGAQIELDHDQNVHIIGLKMEGENQLVQMNDCMNCSIFGMSGEAHSVTLPLIQLDGTAAAAPSDRIWYSLLDRTIKTGDTGTYPWIVSGTTALVSGTKPVALFKQGGEVILQDGYTETFANSSHFVRGANYNLVSDDNGHPCMKFLGTGGTPEIFCSNQTRVDTTGGYQVSVQVKEVAPPAPANDADSPTLIFLSNTAFFCYTYHDPESYSTRITASGTLKIVGPGIMPAGEVDVPVGAYLNGGTNSATSWNRMSVSVSGSTARIFVNGNYITSISGSDIALAQDLATQAYWGPTYFGLTGRNNVKAYFENYSYFPPY